MQAAIVKSNMNGDVIGWDQGAELVFGYRPDEIIGQPVSLIVPERFRAGHERGIINYARTRVANGLIGRELDVYGLRKTGEEFPLRVHLTVEGDTFVNRMKDISVERAAEDKLRVVESMEPCEPWTLVLCDPVLADQRNFLDKFRAAGYANRVLITVSAAEIRDYVSARNRFFGRALVPWILVTEHVLPDSTSDKLATEMNAYDYSPRGVLVCTDVISVEGAIRKPFRLQDAGLFFGKKLGVF